MTLLDTRLRRIEASPCGQVCDSRGISVAHKEDGVLDKTPNDKWVALIRRINRDKDVTVNTSDQSDPFIIWRFIQDAVLFMRYRYTTAITNLPAGRGFNSSQFGIY